MKPSKPLRRKRPLSRSRSSLSSGQTRKRGGPIKKRGKKPSTFAHQYGSRARVAFVKSLPCCFPTIFGPREGHSMFGPCLAAYTPSDNMHIGRRAGTGRKGHHTEIVPGCRFHHLRWHREGRETFLAKHGMTEADLTRIAAETENRWLASSGRADSPKNED